MVVASVTVRGWAGIIIRPPKNLGIPWAVLKDRRGRWGIMAAGCPDSELFLWGSS